MLISVFEFVYFLNYLWLTVLASWTNSSCGRDNTHIEPIYEGLVNISMYPWLGVLYYPTDTIVMRTTVVLVTSQICLASAAEVDRMPKKDFRAKSRVVLGNNCDGHHIRVKDYAYNPEYEIKSYSAISLIQLGTYPVSLKVHPICAPQSVMSIRKAYAFSIAHEDCQNNVQVHEMNPVNNDDCRQFYRKSGLNMESFWPTFSTCSKSTHGKECYWQNGVVLATKDEDRWYLVGLGVQGPGCGAPSRFIDYRRYRPWVTKTIARTGAPTVSQVNESYVVLRKRLSNLQRYGKCDEEETLFTIFTDATLVQPSFKVNRFVHASYNVYEKGFGFPLLKEETLFTIFTDATLVQPSFKVNRFVHASYNVYEKGFGFPLLKEETLFTIFTDATLVQPSFKVNRFVHASYNVYEKGFGFPLLKEETLFTIFTDATLVQPSIKVNRFVHASYNLTLTSLGDYSCVVFMVYNNLQLPPSLQKINERPKIRVRKWCLGPLLYCYSVGQMNIEFYVDIYFAVEIVYEVRVYGKETLIIDPKKKLRYYNEKREHPEIVVL